MKLKCHCGNIEISVSAKPETLTSCNCSICNRYGSLWGYYLPEDVDIKVGKDDIQPYIWGDQCL